MMEVSTAFSKLINNNEPEDFVKLLPEIQRNKQLFNEVKEHFLSLENDEINSTWTCLESICTNTLVKCCSESDSQEGVSKFDNGCIVLSGIAVFALLTVEEKTRNITDSLIQTVVILNGVLFTLPASQFKLKSAIACVCEKWWSNNIEGKEKLFLNLLIYLLKKVTAEKYLKSDLKRIWNLRYGFNLIPLQSEAGENIKELLIICMKSSNLLDNSDGMKILSLFLCLDEELMLDLHQAVKENIPYCTKTQARAYGHVYNKSWSCIKGTMKEKLEADCIQDFMFHAIHAKANPYSPFVNLKEFLSTFHSLRHQKDMGSMLFKLYEPILWRSFKVPSSIVRGNAAAILIDAFPLENAEIPLNENDEWQQKQFAIINELLKDPCPKIRMVAAIGVCTICDRYWALIPTDVIHKWILTLIDDLRLDASSSSVRMNVLKGLIQILNNPLSHQFLKTVLPRVGNSFHDISENVRVAVTDLLLKLKNMKSIEYWTVVPPDHLFARLAIESPPVARRIVKILKTSFFPKNEDNSVAVDRAIHLIKTHRAASRKFYRFVHEFMDLKESVDFILTINPYLKLYAHKKFVSCKNEYESGGISDGENVDPNVIIEDNEDCLDDPEILTGLIDIVGIIWAGINYKLRKSENTKLEKKLQETYKDTVELFARCCKENLCWDSLLFLTSFLPSNQVSSICKHCLLRIKTLPAGSKADVFGTFVVNLCRWDFLEELCDILFLWLSAAFNPKSFPTTNSKKRVKKGVRFVEPYDEQPLLACEILCWMLEEPYCQQMLLYNRQPVVACWQQLKSCLLLIEQRLNDQTLNEYATDEFLEKAFASYCRITIVLQKEPLHESARLIGEVLDWAIAVVIPKLIGSTENKEIVHLSAHLIQLLLLVISDMALVSLLNPVFTRNAFEFSKSVLILENGHYFLEHISRFTYQLTEFCLTRKDKNVIIKELNELIPDLTNCLIESLVMQIREQRSTTFEIPEAMTSIFIEILESYFKHKATNHFSFKDILSTFVVAVISDLAADVKKNQGYPMYDNWDEIPLLSKFFLSIFSAKPRLITLFISEIKKCVDSGELRKFPGPLVVAGLLQLLSKEKKFLKTSVMKTTIESAQKLLSVAESHHFNESEQEPAENNTNLNFDNMAKLTADLLNEVSNLLKSSNES